MQADDSPQFTGAVLAVLTAAALAVGIGWWVSAAPPAALPPDRAGSPVVGDEGDWAVDGDRVPEGHRTPQEIVPVEDNADRRLPRFAGTIHRQVHRLASDDWEHREIPATSGGRYLVQFVCVVEGGLEVRLGGTGPEIRRERVACGETFESVEVTAADKALTIAVRKFGPGPVEAAVQVLSLP